MISRETIDEISQKVSIVDLVSLYAEVKHKGSSYVACCPFHNEKTPSFHISPDKGVYHCFGCGESGNIFSFLMKIAGLSFSDAVTELANKFNIEIKYTDVKFNDNKKDIDSLYKVNVLAYKYFEYSLRVNSSLLKPYLEKRKITNDTIKQFYIGYAPNDWQGLYNFLKKSKVPESVMELSGLFYRNQSGNLYDVFRGRLIFPVLSMPKKIAGFGGRIIPGIASIDELEKSPKYLNSKETLVYEKSKILYNFVNARDEIKRQKYLFLVEGYMDVVGLSRVNIKNVIATCGTSLTTEHAKKIENLNVNVVVMFDADNAGYNAAARAFSIFLNTKINAQALFLPSGEDPDSLADKEGENTLNILTSLPKISLLEAYFRKLLRDEGIEYIGQASPSIKEKISEKLLEIIAKINSSIKRLEVLKESSFLLQIPVEILDSEMKKLYSHVTSFESTSSNISDKSVHKNKKIPLTSLPSIDREVVSIVLKDVGYIDKILENSDLCQFLSYFTLEFLESIKNIMQQNVTGEHNVSCDAFNDEFKKLLLFYGQDYAFLCKSLNSVGSNFNITGAYEQCLRLAERLKKDEMIRGLEKEIQLTRDEGERLLLIKKLLEIKKNI